MSGLEHLGDLQAALGVFVVERDLPGGRAEIAIASAIVIITISNESNRMS
jgi:hypothetical protein